MDDTQRLQQLKVAIETSKTEKAKQEGRLAEIQSTLKNEFEVNTIKAAKELQAKLQKQEQDLEAEIHRGLAELETQFTW